MSVAEWFEARFRDGDPLALDQSVIACCRLGEPFPAWVREALLQRSHQRIAELVRPLAKKYPRLRLSAIYADELERSRPNKGGRIGRPIDWIKRQYLVGYIDAARHRGLTVDSAVEVAISTLKRQGIKYEFESAKEKYWELRRRFGPHPSTLDVWADEIDDTLHGMSAQDRTKLRRVSSARKR